LNSTTARVTDGSGALFTYTNKDGSGVYTPPAGAQNKLVQNGDNTWTESQLDGTTFNYATTGKLATMGRGGATWTVAYDSHSMVSRITDPVGRITTLVNASLGVGTMIGGPVRLKKIIDCVGRIT